MTQGFLDGHRAQLTESLPPDTSDNEPEKLKAQEVPLRIRVATLLREVDRPARPASSPGPDRVRLTAEQVEGFFEKVEPPGGAILEQLDPQRLRQIVETYPTRKVIAALPSVFFEDERGAIEALCREAVLLGVPVEANTWGGWLLARRAGARVLAGPGLGVLNALAVRELAELVFVEATASVEVDAPKLEALVSRACLPCSVVVFARPALFCTRVELPPAVTGAEIEDRRAARLRARRGCSTWELRPVQPFDLRGLRLPPETAHAVVDLVGSENPLAEWEHGVDAASRFNFDRALS